ncbi:hypothetical protein QCD00_004422 [Enterobacter hormaechei]|uniref:virulence-associated E family protein n=1 Tax=Enterobacter cloacae complex TaxID=354276 RepID=UPI00069074ED|nr:MULTISPECIES: virulence-associated E family protein [Enterobacter cloacae complex]EKS6640569.1 hypothetical protein [Enterobacter hormaechei]ELD2070317.1 hypothetical protein [Enterobacter hormaechei]MXS02704.1 hypothetical protein [Enterobacter hormaechei]POU02828.1 hypothetical protein C3376_18445 [Enterobacter cloacae complex sp. ECNIH17]POV24648.1 hypothetical protein C3386_19950 [Enterobacter cloacae complex sp. ECNIH12]
MKSQPEKHSARSTSDNAVDNAREEVQQQLDALGAKALGKWKVNTQTGEVHHPTYKSDRPMTGELRTLRDACQALRKAIDDQRKVDLLDFDCDRKGEIRATSANILTGLGEKYTGYRIAFDAFRGDMVIASSGSSRWRTFTDSDYTMLTLRLETYGVPASKDRLRQCVAYLAEQNAVDSAIEWLNGLEWDGVQRVGNFCHEYFGTEDSDYTRAVSAYIWTALAGRVLEPGVKADMAPVLVGAQGMRKSEAFKTLCPSLDMFREIDLLEKEEILARKLRGALVAEIPEMKGMSSKRQEVVKAMMSRTKESWRPLFKEFNQEYPRRCLFFGTENNEEFLHDVTGNRRWLPMSVIERIDTDLIARDRDQLWAEGAAMFRAGGVAFAEAEILARAQHDTYRTGDVWEGLVAEWLAKRPARETERLTARDLLTNVIQLTKAQMTVEASKRMGAVLRALGYQSQKGAKGMRYFMKETETPKSLKRKPRKSSIC